MNGRSFKLLTVFGMPIKVHVSWFIIFALIVYTLRYAAFPELAPGLGGGLYWLMATVAALLLFVSVLLHELGHSFLALRHNIPVRGITLFLFGGVSQIAEEPRSPRAEAEVTVAGWVVTAIIALVCLLAWKTLPTTTAALQAVSAVIYYLMLINVVLLAFNAVPGFPLDGGRLLRALLWWTTGNLRQATYVASSVGSFVGLVFIVGGLFLALAGGVIGGVWLALMGWFLRGAAQSSYRQLLVRRALEGVPVGELMAASVVCIPGDISLQQAVDEWFMTHRFDGFPICGPEGLQGMLTLDEVRAVARDHWLTTTTAEAMDTRATQYAVPPEMDAMHVLARMSQYDVGRIPVVVDGELVGIVTRRDIVKLLRLKADLEGVE